jgi:hypothetical protein
MKNGLKREAPFFVVVIVSIFFLANPLQAQVDKGAQDFGPPLWGPSADAGKKVINRETTSRGTKETYGDGSSVEFGGGVVLEKFPEGTTIDTVLEGTGGGKTKVVTWPNKTGYIVFPDGTGAAMDSDGTIYGLKAEDKVEIRPDGSVVVSHPTYQSEHLPSGVSIYSYNAPFGSGIDSVLTRYPDGHGVWQEGDGSTRIEYPDGPIAFIVKDGHGNTRTHRRDNTVLLEKSDGTKEEMSSDDYYKRKVAEEEMTRQKADAALPMMLPDRTKYIWLGDGKGATILPDGTVIPFYCPPGLDLTRPDCPPPMMQAIQKADSDRAYTPSPSVEQKAPEKPAQKTQENPVYRDPFGYSGQSGGRPYGEQMDPGYTFGGQPPWMPGIPWDTPAKEPREHPDKTLPWDIPPKKK